MSKKPPKEKGKAPAKTSKSSSASVNKPTWFDIVTKEVEDTATSAKPDETQNIPKELVVVLSNPEILQTLQNLAKKATGPIGEIRKSGMIPQTSFSNPEVSSSSSKPLLQNPSKEMISIPGVG